VNTFLPLVDYQHPKYKRSLDRWNKDTRGGDGSPASFHKYCDGGAWLVWLFCLDKEQTFLAAANTGGRMLNHLQFEAGFRKEYLEEMSDIT